MAVPAAPKTLIDVNRSLARDSRGNMLWDTEDVVIETVHGDFTERRLIGQPNGGVVHRLGPGGIMVLLFNQHPGGIYNERGVRVPDSFWTGTDLEELKKKRRRKAAMALAASQVEEEFSNVAAHKVIKEQDEYRLVEIGPQHFQIQFIET